MIHLFIKKRERWKQQYCRPFNGQNSSHFPEFILKIQLKKKKKTKKKKIAKVIIRLFHMIFHESNLTEPFPAYTASQAKIWIGKWRESAQEARGVKVSARSSHTNVLHMTQAKLNFFFLAEPACLKKKKIKKFALHIFLFVWNRQKMKTKMYYNARKIFSLLIKDWYIS